MDVLKRTSPNLVPCLVAGRQDFGDMNTLHEKIITHEVKTNQALSGNRCGHSPTQPRSPNFSHHKIRPARLEKAKKRLGESYFNPHKYEIGKLSYDPSKRNKDQSSRKRRSELKETITHAVGQSILEHLNLKTNVLGVFDKKGEFHNFGIDFLKKTTGFSYYRVRKALKIMEDNGYIAIEKNQFITSGGDFKAMPAIIRVHNKFFLDLGFTEEEIENDETRIRKVAERQALIKKWAEIEKKRKIQKKEQKKEKKTLMALLQVVKNGAPLSEEEQSRLDEEQPGWRRVYQKKPTVTELVTMPNKTILADPQVRKEALAEILNSFKKSPP